MTKLYWVTEKKRRNWLRDPQAEKLYHSTRWRKLRKSLQMEYPTCQMPECSNPSYFCDHMIPYKRGMDFYDEDNLQMLCKSCNASKTAKQ